MTNPLQSSRNMLSRAEQHLNDFKIQHDAFFQTDPYAHFIEMDLNTGEEVHMFRLIKPIPVMLNTIAADALNNIRSSLDQAIFATVKAHDPKKPGRNTHFPIGEHAADFMSRRNRVSSEIPEEIFSMIESFQPYGGGNGAVLWAMSQLCNANKHKLLCTIAYTLGGSLGVTLTQGNNILVRTGPKWDAVKNEIELARCAPGFKIECEIQVRTFLAFSESTFPKKPVEDILADMILQATNIVNAIEIKGREMGFFR